MIIIGLAFLITWLLVQVFSLVLLKAILITAIIYIVIGILVGEYNVIGRVRK